MALHVTTVIFVLWSISAKQERAQVLKLLIVRIWMMGASRVYVTRVRALAWWEQHRTEIGVMMVIPALKTTNVSMVAVLVVLLIAPLKTVIVPLVCVRPGEVVNHYPRPIRMGSLVEQKTHASRWGVVWGADASV
jgi:hypothetical protein